MSKAKFQFSNVVVVDTDQIGVILKTWEGPSGFEYDIYVRSYKFVRSYNERDIKHYVYSKELFDQEKGFYE